MMGKYPSNIIFFYQIKMCTCSCSTNRYHLRVEGTKVKGTHGMCVPGQEQYALPSYQVELFNSVLLCSIQHTVHDMNDECCIDQMFHASQSNVA